MIAMLLIVGICLLGVGFGIAVGMDKSRNPGTKRT